MNSLARLVTDVQADPASIVSVAQALAERLPAVQGREAWGATKHVGQFIEVSTRALLGWVSTGRDDQARGLIEALEQLLSRGGAADPLAGLPPAEQLAAGLRQMLFVAETYVKTDNLALPLGKLQGQRRRAWRLALHLADGAGGGLLTAPAAVDAGLFERRNTASHALNELAKLGLLERQVAGDEGGAGDENDDDRDQVRPDYVAVFRLTFAGRQVCRELRRMQIDPDREVERARAGGRREEESSFWSSSIRAARHGGAAGHRADERRHRKGLHAIAQAVRQPASTAGAAAAAAVSAAAAAAGGRTAASGRKRAPARVGERAHALSR